MFYKADGNSEIYSRRDETSLPLAYHGLGNDIKDKWRNWQRKTFCNRNKYEKKNLEPFISLKKS